MPARKALLDALLLALLEEWGHERVNDALLRLQENEDAEKRTGTKVARSQNKEEKRPSAINQVERLAIPPERKSALTELALRYDAKEILPSVSEARQFLLMAGAKPVSLKDRSEAFRHMTRLLMSVPQEQFHRIISRLAYAGVSRLGPLSDAISDRAGSMERPTTYKK